jgi:hypothetical protein
MNKVLFWMLFVLFNLVAIAVGTAISVAVSSIIIQFLLACIFGGGLGMILWRLDTP